MIHAKHLTTVLIAGVSLCLSVNAAAQEPARAYRLNSVDLKQRIIWGAECLQPEGRGLAFGGQDQDADDGRPHTRVLVDGEWLRIDQEMRDANPLQGPLSATTIQRNETKKTLAKARYLFFQGLEYSHELERVIADIVPEVNRIRNAIHDINGELPTDGSDPAFADRVLHVQYHLKRAVDFLPSLEKGMTAEALKGLHEAQTALEIAAESLAGEPPPRAMNCGTARLSSQESGPESNTLVYDAKTKLYVLFGGDHLDYLTNDTWVFDPAKRRWTQRLPRGAPPPRANHRLEATGDGTIRLTGGYTYTSNTGYISGQYADLNDGTWTYDIEKNEWSGGELVPAYSRTYRSGPLHPDYYFQGPKPNAAEFAAWLEKLPVNEWVPTDPPHLPRLNRDWGTARIDPDRDMILRWSGGHSAHGGTDVLHYHFATNRWELPFPVEFPLGQLYSNTSYPNGYNFNRRPWMTGHTYQNYDYDPPSKMMIKAGRPRHSYTYDPGLGDWIDREKKPEAMQYNSCFYTLTLTATPHGVICWDKNGKVHRYVGGRLRRGWVEIELSGDELPGAYVDNSTIAYDSNRDRVLMINTPGYKQPYDGTIWELDLASKTVKQLRPDGHDTAHRFANVDKCCYDAANDLLLIGTYLRDAGDHTPTPAYDCANNRWLMLNLKYSTTMRLGSVRRAFPQSRSDGMVYDPKRKLIWGTNTNSQVYVLRLDPGKAAAARDDRR